MNDRAVSLLDNYEFTVTKTKKGRGAIILETNQGLKLFVEYNGPKDKVLNQERLMTHVKNSGFPWIDCFVLNKENEILTINYDGKAYAVKDYYDAGECSVTDRKTCIAAAVSLAKLHLSMRNVPLDFSDTISTEMMDGEFKKRNMELGRVRSFIRKKADKNDFELEFLQYFSYFEAQAKDASMHMERHVMDTLCKKIIENSMFCHGDCSHHNLLLENGQFFIVNFERFRQDIQVKDLVLFLRKILEKNNWSSTLGMDIVNTYKDTAGLEYEELSYIYARLIYPEKFWKIANGYLNQRKSLPAKRQGEKLHKLLSGESKRQEFLKAFADQYL